MDFLRQGRCGPLKYIQRGDLWPLKWVVAREHDPQYDTCTRHMEATSDTSILECLRDGEYCLVVDRVHCFDFIRKLEIRRIDGGLVFIGTAVGLLERELSMDAIFDVVLAGIEIDEVGWHRLDARERVIS